MSQYFNTEDILLPYTYINKIKGKGIRSYLIDAFNKWFNIDQANLDKIKKIIEMLHNSSLIIDDIEDYSELRRGIPTAHVKYGVPLSINAGNMIYFVALKEILSFGKTEMVESYTKCMIELHRGQGKDIYIRDCHLFTKESKDIIPTEEDYTHMVMDKTGGLFKLAFEMMGSLSSTVHQTFDLRGLIDLIGLIGLFYQIRDDYMNITSSEYETSKGFCEDFSEGKISYIIIKSIEKDITILDDIRQKPDNYKDKKRLLDRIIRTGSLDYVKEYLVKLKDKISLMILSLGGNDLLTNFIQKLTI